MPLLLPYMLADGPFNTALCNWDGGMELFWHILALVLPRTDTAYGCYMSHAYRYSIRLLASDTGNVCCILQAAKRFSSEGHEQLRLGGWSGVSLPHTGSVAAAQYSLVPCANMSAVQCYRSLQLLALTLRCTLHELLANENDMGPFGAWKLLRGCLSISFY
jgi:hypothetical protein